jgi:hypothetical protein
VPLFRHSLLPPLILYPYPLHAVCTPQPEVLKELVEGKTLDEILAARSKPIASTSVPTTPDA